MKITISHIELRRVHIPLRQSFTISGGTMTEKQCLIVRIQDSTGAVGYGEAALSSAPIYLSETIDGAFAVLQQYFLPPLKGCSFSVSRENALVELEQATAYLSVWKGFEFSKAAIAQALSHLVAVRIGCSLQTLFGGTRTRIDVGESIGLKPSIASLMEEVDQRVLEGYKRIKLKIKPGHDLELVQAVRTKYPRIPLMVDANSAYSLDDLDLFKAMDAYDLLMIEQPLAYDDLYDHAVLQKQIRTPLCLDESVLRLQHARQAVEHGSCRIINIKPGRVAGPLSARRIHDYCFSNNVPVWCGGMFESGIGRAFNIALASLPGFTLPADMSPSSILLQYDLVSDPYTVEKGEIAVPTVAGLGYVIDDTAMDRATVALWHVA